MANYLIYIPASNVTDHHARLLLLCTGQLLVKCTPSKRQELYDRAWDLITGHLGELIFFITIN